MKNLPPNWYEPADPYIDVWVDNHHFSMVRGAFDFHLRKIFFDETHDSEEYIDIAPPNADGKFQVTPIGPKSFRWETRTVLPEQLPETLDWALGMIRRRALTIR